MKRFPVTTIPAALVAIIVSLFIFYVPNGEDLVSEAGDPILGQFLGVALIVCIIVDYKRFKHGQS